MEYPPESILTWIGAFTFAALVMGGFIYVQYKNTIAEEAMMASHFEAERARAKAAKAKEEGGYV